MSQNVPNMLEKTIAKIREMVDVNSVIGDPITTPDGVTIIPVSKVSYGFASGGSDLPSKSSSDLFGGGAGAGINITPVAFLTVKDGEINLLPVVSKPDTVDRLVSLVPDAVNKVSDLFKKKDEKED